ncbi:hypothetical protein [Halopenitus sp. POP-27]|uniref:hypothetical protein n=1 Tax=Halopenitus sp. POP-27 TaxID=2994425 RepID=UPI002469A02D|nr:hypothetical protein [Halopenitus sp. POP-27]
MRFKMLPTPPGDLDRVREAQRAVPLVPGDESDCCARLQRRLDFPSRDVARTWLTFLRALELAQETDVGFSRTDREPTVEHLRTSFLDRVLLAPETLAAVAAVNQHATDAGERGVSPDAVFDRVRDDVPTYEHHKNPDTWETIWHDRTADLLGWLALLDLVDAVDAEADAVDAVDGYVLTDRGRTAIDDDR